MRMPTRLGNGEGRAERGRNRHMHPFWSAGVVGTARWQGNAGYRGRPVVVGWDPTSWQARRARQESERVVVLLKPGNAGGGKGPYFWHACEGAEQSVIGDEPGNTNNLQTLSNKLYGTTKTARRGSCREACRRAGCGRSARPVVCPAKAGVFSRSQTCRGKSQAPRSLDGRVAGNQDSEAHRQSLPRGDCESPGRNESERASGLENE